MNITKLTALNLKGRTFSHDLSPITIFTGPNGAGKTTRLAALQLALTGSIPGHGKRAADIFQFAGPGSVMHCGLSIDGPDGVVRTIVRKWEKKRGAVKTHKPQLIDMPEDFDIPPVMMDADAGYFGMSSKARDGFVVSLCQNATVDIGDITEAMTDATQAANEIESLKEIRNGYLDDLENSYDQLSNTGQSTPDWFTEQFADATAKKNAATASAKRLKAALDAAVAMEGAEIDLVSPAECEAQLANLRPDAEAKQKEAVELGAKNGEYRRVTDRRQSLELALRDHQACRDRLKEAENALAAAREAVSDDRVSDTPLLKEEQSTVLMSLAKHQAEIGGMARTIQEHETSLKELEKAGGSCPTCKSAAKGWKAKAKKAIEEMIGELNKSKGEQEKEFTAIQKQRMAIDERVTKSEAQDRAAAQASLAVQRAKTDLETVKGKLATLDSLAEELKGLGAVEIPSDFNDKWNAAINASREAKENVGAWEQRLRASNAAIQKEETRRLQLLELAASEAEVDMWKAVIAELETARTKMIDSSFAPILEVTNRVAGAVLPHPLAYHDGEICFADGAHRWPFATMSDAEKMVTMCAAGIALATATPIKLLIVDELGRMGPQRKFDFLEHVSRLIRDGVIDQLVCADPVETLSGDEYPENYLLTVIPVVE